MPAQGRIIVTTSDSGSGEVFVKTTSGRGIAS